MVQRHTLSTGLCEYTVMPSTKWLKTKIFSPWPGSKLGSMRSPLALRRFAEDAGRMLVLGVAPPPRDSLPNWAVSGLIRIAIVGFGGV